MVMKTVHFLSYIALAFKCTEHCSCFANKSFATVCEFYAGEHRVAAVSCTVFLLGSVSPGAQMTEIGPDGAGERGRHDGLFSA